MSRGHVGRAAPAPATDPVLELARAYDRDGWQLVPQRWKAGGRRPGNVPIRGLTGQIGHRTPEQVADAVRADVGDRARIVDEPGARPRGDLIPGARIPAGVVALDVDHYGDKHGHDTLAAMEAEHGPLPDTWTVTARGPESLARKWLYRLPPGTVLTDRWFGTYGGDVDVLRLTHRYVHAPGARHLRTNTPVLAYPPGGGPGVERMPPVADLPELPAPWCKAAAAYYHEQARVDGSGLRVDGEPEQLTEGHADSIVARATRRLEELPPSGAEFRNAVYALARVCALHARALDGSPDEAEIYTWQQFGEAHPGLVPDRDDEQWTAEAVAKAWHVPGWEITDEPEPRERDDDEPEHEAPGPPDPDAKRARALAVELERQEITQEAREIREARARPAITPLSFADFLASPPPEYLVPRMLYRDGLATVFGPPGAAKSFLVLDLALSMAAGRAWQGHALGQRTVHYVMAEGRAVNNLRTKAWLAHHDVSPDDIGDRFRAFDEGVSLTPAGIRSYLPHVQHEQPDMIVLDTKNLMYEGKESAGDDLGAMLRVLHTLRQAAGGCAVVLIDHTGLNDDTRVRGGNAQRGGMETEIRVVQDGPSGLRHVSITRDKAGGATAPEWWFRLEPVDEVPVGPDQDTPVVPVPVDDPGMTGDGPSIHGDDDWRSVLLPADVAGWRGIGRETLSEVAALVLFYGSHRSGISRAEVISHYRAHHPGIGADSAKKRVGRAWDALHELNRLTAANPNSSSLITHHRWDTRADDPTKIDNGGDT